jgi:hypothetical protein
MNSRLLITLLCAGAVALACGSLSRNETNAAQAASSRSTSMPRPALSTARVAKSASSAATAASKVNGQFVVTIEPHALRFVFDLTNAGKKHVELAFPNGQQYDFAVQDSAGREVYRWGAGRMFTQSVQNKLIDGGKTLRFTERAETTLPQGRYVAIATLRSTNFPMTQRSEFAVR